MPIRRSVNAEHVGSLRRSEDTVRNAGKAHPELTGGDLVITYASNSPDFDTLVSDSSLYYPRFVRATVDSP